MAMVKCFEYAQVTDNPYAREIVKIRAKYSEGWTCSSISAQAESLSAEFPGLRLDDAEKDAAKMVCPASADGLGILLKIRAIGRIYGVKNPYDSGYSDVNRCMLAMIVRNCPDILLPYESYDGNFIHIYPDVKEKIICVETFDNKDYTILPINFGDFKTGYLYSPRRVRWDALVRKDKLPCVLPQMCGLLKTNLGIMTNYYDNLFFNCPGDRINKDSDSRGMYCPCFGISSEDDSRLKLYAQNECHACDGTGSVIAYL